MNETSKATISGVLDLAAGVMGWIGGCVLLLLGLVGGGVLGATVPEEAEWVAIAPYALFLPLALMLLVAGTFAVFGGLAALQRKRWWLAVAGSIAALFCFFPLGIPATIFTVLAEGEFGRA